MTKTRWISRFAAPVAAALIPCALCAADLTSDIEDALRRADANRTQLQSALKEVPDAQREGMEFLIANMPERDLTTLNAEFLLENVKYAYEALEKAPWGKDIPREVFLNDLLPFANVNERRDQWRRDFYMRFSPFVKGCTNASLAAARLNQKVFPAISVHYSTQRPKADQSPYESIEAGMASCTGLSILLVDACRAVGIPARFAGTPLWTNLSGNHSWVEVWDKGWNFAGAAEASGDKLNQAWFAGRATTAQRDHPLHAIYAVSFKKTPLLFPLSWNPQVDYVHAVNVTDRYAPPPEAETDEQDDDKP